MPKMCAARSLARRARLGTFSLVGSLIRTKRLNIKLRTHGMLCFSYGPSLLVALSLSSFSQNGHVRNWQGWGEPYDDAGLGGGRAPGPMRKGLGVSEGSERQFLQE